MMRAERWSLLCLANKKKGVGVFDQTGSGFILKCGEVVTKGCLENMGRRCK